MDYSLAALKLLSQLNDAKESTAQKSNAAFTLEGILFQRAWLQGILVSTRNADPSGRFLLDDGTGVIELLLSGDFLNLSLEECILWLLEGILSVKAAPLYKATNKIFSLSSKFVSVFYERSSAMGVMLSLILMSNVDILLVYYKSEVYSYSQPQQLRLLP